ncbi:hypothetical protein AVEN_115863-1 [Araneus ventricosus]|uniref:Uncharacterized protein n=1 Tax=Araneus ventricosus TaxID=182803 RepID=A0A4Y2K5V9_ARAVE|nr:hypothetical protein AVEN_115863-1 [Araneus ventricosus]
MQDGALAYHYARATLAIWRGSCYQSIFSIRIVSQISRSDILQNLVVEIPEVNSIPRQTAIVANITKGASRQHMSTIQREMLLVEANGLAPRLTAVLLNDGHYTEQLQAYL